jgi:hypothetical protein
MNPPVLTNLQIWLNFLAPICLAIVTGVLTYMVSRMGARQEASNTRQEKHLVEIQTFTNSALGMAMKVGAAALRRVADLTQSPADKTIAETAEAQAVAHEAAQKVVDIQNAAAKGKGMTGPPGEPGPPGARGAIGPSGNAYEDSFNVTAIGYSLKVAAAALRRVADTTGDDTDKKLAEAAEAHVAAHEKHGGK